MDAFFPPSKVTCPVSVSSVMKCVMFLNLSNVFFICAPDGTVVSAITSNAMMLICLFISVKPFSVAWLNSKWLPDEMAESVQKAVSAWKKFVSNVLVTSIWARYRLCGINQKSVTNFIV